MSIWDFVVDEFRKNNGSYLNKQFKDIYVEYQLGGISEIQAKIICEREYDKTYSIYK